MYPCFLIHCLSAGVFASLPAPHVGLTEPLHSHTGWFEILTNRIVMECEVDAVGEWGWAVCCAGGAHRMELSSRLVLGLQPVSRKSRAVVHCHSEWTLRVQCDGQSGAAHTGPLCQAFLDSVSIFSVSLTQWHTHTHSFTKASFFSFSWSRQGKSSRKQSLTCLCFSCSLYFSFCLSSSHSCIVARTGERRVLKRLEV